jgi:hypothetical protein
MKASIWGSAKVFPRAVVKVFFILYTIFCGERNQLDSV